MNTIEQWEKFKEEKRARLKGQYLDGKRTKAIQEAVTLWIFIQKFLGSAGLEARREFLKGFFPDGNSYLVLVAVIESLPTSLWRKLLTAHNIDFMSFESCLRRLEFEGEEWDAIINNYHDLFIKGMVPRVFSRFVRWRNKITVASLLSEPLDFERRYGRKGSFVRNLLGLGFGFNRYPKGPDDDSQNPEEGKFFSEKNRSHEDFVVNEDSSYDWLYVKARSNYVWFPNRVVKLKKAICPGFWWTFIVHAWFWIVSPVAATSLIVALQSGHPSWWTLSITAAFGFLTPLWLSAAVFKLLFTALGKYVLTDEFSKSLKTQGRDMGKAALTALFVAAAASGVFFALFYGIKGSIWIFRHRAAVIAFLSKAFMVVSEWLRNSAYWLWVHPWLIVALLTFGLFVGCKIAYGEGDRSGKFKDFHPFWRGLILLGVICLGADGLLAAYPFLAAWAAKGFFWIGWSLSRLPHWLWKAWLIVWPFLAGSAAVAGLALLVLYSDRYLEKVFSSRLAEKLIDWFAKASLALTLISLIAVPILYLFGTARSASGSAGQAGNWTMSWIVLIGLALFFIGRRLRTKTMASFAKLAANFNEKHLSGGNKFGWRKLYKNPWLRELEDGQKEQVLWNSMCVLERFFDGKKELFWGTDVLLPSANGEMLDYLRTLTGSKEFRDWRQKERRSETRAEVLAWIVEGKGNFKSALINVYWQERCKEVLREKRKQKLIRAFSVLIPLWIFLKAVGRLIKAVGLWLWNIPVKTVEYALDFRKLWKKIHDACPWIVEPGLVKGED